MAKVKYVPLVLRAQQLWDELARSVAKPCLNAPASLTSAPASSAFLANVAASARAFQLSGRAGCPGRDAALAGDTPPPMTIGRFSEPASGVLRSELAVETWDPSGAGSGLRAAIQLSGLRLFITMC